jgi:hypothetical protein
MWLYWLACVSDPEVDAWHRSMEVTSATLATETCDAEPVEAEPVEDYLLTAINRGVPDISSLYWCTGPEECDVPYGSVVLTEFTENTLVGDISEPIVDIGGCTFLWFDLAATRTDEGVVDLHFRSGRLDVAELDPDACVESAVAAIGEACLETWHVTGVQVD